MHPRKTRPEGKQQNKTQADSILLSLCIKRNAHNQPLAIWWSFTQSVHHGQHSSALRCSCTHIGMNSHTYECCGNMAVCDWHVLHTLLHAHPLWYVDWFRSTPSGEHSFVSLLMSTFSFSSTSSLVEFFQVALSTSLMVSNDFAWLKGDCCCNQELLSNLANSHRVDSTGWRHEEIWQAVKYSVHFWQTSE